MRVYTFLVYLILSTLVSCDSREQKLRKKELELQQKEQELLLKEKELELKVKELNRNHENSKTEASTNDSIPNNTEVTGSWAVKMVCVETDCEGSAIGDIKNEHWDISYQNNTILAKAKANNKLVRVYSGGQNGKIIELSAKQSAGESAPAAKMLVKLKQVSTDKIEGRREIFREGCRIIYSLELNKQ